MYICLCKGISDRALQQAVCAGASSFRDVREQLGVATQCGKCARAAKAIVADALAEQQGIPANSLSFYDAATAIFGEPAV
jgi:bacterioferritin-associated ferredoxin